jgi:hypothetical protein
MVYARLAIVVDISTAEVVETAQIIVKYAIVVARLLFPTPRM